MVLLIILVLIIMDTQNKHKLAQPKNKNTNKCIKKSKSIKKTKNIPELDLEYEYIETRDINPIIRKNFEKRFPKKID
jgi:hypothetical protein